MFNYTPTWNRRLRISEKKIPCTLCNSRDTEVFFSLPPVPTQDGVMYHSKNAALNAPKGSIKLNFCKSCGFIVNVGYEEEKVNFDDYDFSNDHSPMFMEFVEGLCQRLIKKYSLRDSLILDIGCGDGAFLKKICKLGNNRGIGIDPGFDHQKNATKLHNVTFLRQYYSEEHADLSPDLIVCRLVIDLLDNQTDFLNLIRRNLDNSPDTIVYIEVPYANYTFEERVIWNVVYEHKAWYTPESFVYQFEKCGFEVLSVAPCWNNEFLGIEVKPRMTPQFPSYPSSEKIEKLSQTISDFEKDFRKQMDESQLEIEEIKRDCLTVAAWGAGARAVSFFNLFDLLEEVPFIVDINVKRHGKFLPGSGQEIVAPEFLLEYQPDLIIVTNPTYANEIISHARSLGLESEFWVL